MKRLARIASVVLIALACVFALGSCTINVNINQGSSSGSAESASAADTGASINGAASISSGTTDKSSATDSSGSSSPGNTSGEASSDSQNGASSGAISVTEDGKYSDKDSVALYIHTYGHLPSNYISKTKARKAGWVSTKGNLWDVLPGMSIGGSEYYNDDGQLPDKAGRRWTECDIDFDGGYRNAKRIVFSNDGLIYYTNDHYKTFEQLY